MSEHEVEGPDFRQIVEHSPEYLLVVATDAPTYTIVAVSNAFLDLTGTERDAIVGESVFDAFPENPKDPDTTDLHRVESAFERAIEEKEPVTTPLLRYDIPQSEGFEERYWMPKTLPVVEEGRVDYIIHRVEDMTSYVQGRRDDDLDEAERGSQVVTRWNKAVEEKTRRQFFKLFMQAPAFIAMFEGPEHTFTLANDAYRELVGHREITGRTVRQVFPEEEIEPFFEMLDKVYRTGEPEYFEEEEMIFREPDTGDPERRYGTFVYLPNYDLHGNIDGIAVFGFEVTELVEARKKVEEQAARAERQNRHKDEFLAMLGHELRNPLAPISTAVEVLRIDDDPDEKRLEWATSMIGRQLRHITRLVDDLLDVARINQGRIELDREVCRLDGVLTSAIETSHPMIEEKDQQFESTLPDAPIRIEADPARLIQVITNLLNNASKYTDEGGRIELNASVDGEDLTIEVVDYGQGIDPDLLPHIFDLFTQGHSTIDRSEGGLGIGLTLVHRICEMHGGTIEAHSEGKDEGSRFVVELPIVVDSGEGDEIDRVMTGR